MEEVLLCIVRFLTDTPHPLHGLPEAPQCSKKTESFLRIPTPHPLLLEPTSKEMSDHNQTRKLGNPEGFGLTQPRLMFAVHKHALDALGQRKAGSIRAIPFLITGFCFPTDLKDLCSRTGDILLFG